MDKEKLAQIIFDMIFTGAFADWYADEFEDFVNGEKNAPTKEQVIGWIASQLENSRLVKQQ